jgi:hypothetical protein
MGCVPKCCQTTRLRGCRLRATGPKGPRLFQRRAREDDGAPLESSRILGTLATALADWIFAPPLAPLDLPSSPPRMFVATRFLTLNTRSLRRGNHLLCDLGGVVHRRRDLRDRFAGLHHSHEELELADEDGLEPSAVLHLLRGKAFSPATGAGLRQIRERTIGGLQAFKLLDQCLPG